MSCISIFSHDFWHGLWWNMFRLFQCFAYLVFWCKHDVDHAKNSNFIVHNISYLFFAHLCIERNSFALSPRMSLSWWVPSWISWTTWLWQTDALINAKMKIPSALPLRMNSGPVLFLFVCQVRTRCLALMHLQTILSCTMACHHNEDPATKKKGINFWFTGH